MRLGYLSVPVAIAVACSGSADNEQAPLPARHAETLLGSDLFRVSDPRTGAKSQVTRPKVACNAEGVCLTIWAQMLPDGRALVARRTHGVVMDEGLIRFPEPASAYGYAVGAGDEEFLVAWQDSEGGGLHAVRIDAGDGSIIDEQPLSLSTELIEPLGVTFAGGRYCVLVQTDSLRCLRLDDEQPLEQEGLWVGDLPDPSWLTPATVAGPASEIAVASDGRLVRLDLLTGVGDSTAIPFAKYGNGGEHGLAFDGANYVVSWNQSGAIRAARVRASDGAMLDPPDDIAQLPGGRVIFPTYGDAFNAFHDGTNTVLMFDRRPATGILIPPNLVRANAAQNQGDFDLPGLSYTGFDASVQGGFGLVVNTSAEGAVGNPSAIFSQVLTSASGAVPTVATGPTLSIDTTYHSIPGAGSDGRDFLVVWLDGADVLYRRVDGETGESLDAPTRYGNVFSSAGDRSPQLIWSGRGHFVIWQARYGMFISCAGHSGLELIPAAACGSGRCARLGGTASSLTISAADPTTGSAYGSALPLNDDGIGIGTNHVSLAATRSSLPAEQRFLAFWSTNVAVRYRLYDGSLNPLTESPRSLAAVSTALPLVAVASDGTRFLLAWMDGATLKTTVMDSEGNGGAIREWGALSSADFSLAHDGGSFLLAFTQGDVTTLRRIDAAGVPVDAGTIIPSRSITASPFGRTMVSQTLESRALASSHLVYGSFYDNNLGPGLSARAELPCGMTEGGAAGAAGDSGEGGIAGVGGGLGTGAAGASGEGGDASGAAGSGEGGFGAGGTRGGGDGGEAATDSGEGGAADPSAGGAPSAGEGGTGVVSAGGHAGVVDGSGGESVRGGTSGIGGTGATSGSGGLGASGAGAGRGGSGSGAPSSGGAPSAAGADSGGEANDDDTPSHGDDGGCGCRTARRGTSKGSWFTLALLGSLLSRRVRRAQRHVTAR